MAGSGSSVNKEMSTPLSQSQERSREKEEHFNPYVLMKLIRENKWEAAKAILEAHPSALTGKLNDLCSTALHVAVVSGHVSIVEELVRMMSPQHLEILDDCGFTPLSYAAIKEVDVRIAQCIVTKNNNTLTIPTKSGRLPVQLAFQHGYTQIGRYLYFQTPKEILKQYIHDNNIFMNLLRFCFISLQHLDIATDLLQRYQDLLFARDEAGVSIVERIATLPFALFNGSRLVFWKRCIYNYINLESESTTIMYSDIEQQDESSPSKGLDHVHKFISNLLGIKDLYKLKLMHAQASQLLSLVCKIVSLKTEETDNTSAKEAFFRAACIGNVEFVVQVSQACPFLMLLSDLNKSWNIFPHVIEYRQAEVFNIIRSIHSKDTQTSWRDFDNGNTILHVVAKLNSHAKLKLNSISGPALQMQREMQWFKEVESLVHPWVTEAQNRDGLKAQELFEQTHDKLREDGEKWMKDTASSCSVVATLIVTIMFAAAFTVPGGNDQTSGFPIFIDKQKKLFMTFIISDVISLFSSATSVLIFLGILTSRYAVEDFHKSLPTKLIFGLFTLFLSIATMVIAFSASILIMLHKIPSLWGHLPVIILASVPVSVFGFLQFPLLLQMVWSTYGPGIFNRKVKHRLHV